MNLLETIDDMFIEYKVVLSAKARFDIFIDVACIVEDVNELLGSSCLV